MSMESGGILSRKQRGSRPDCLGMNLPLSLSTCAPRSKLLPLSVPQFPHVKMKNLIEPIPHDLVRITSVKKRQVVKTWYSVDKQQLLRRCYDAGRKSMEGGKPFRRQPGSENRVGLHSTGSCGNDRCNVVSPQGARGTKEGEDCEDSARGLGPGITSGRP